MHSGGKAWANRLALPARTLSHRLPSGLLLLETQATSGVKYRVSDGVHAHFSVQLGTADPRKSRFENKKGSVPSSTPIPQLLACKRAAAAAGKNL